MTPSVRIFQRPQPGRCRKCGNPVLTIDEDMIRDELPYARPWPPLPAVFVVATTCKCWGKWRMTRAMIGEK